MTRRHSFATVIVGRSNLLREGFARILCSAKFRILASVPCVNELLTGEVPSHRLLFLVVHTADDFNATVQQIELLRTRHSNGRIAVVADHYRSDELVKAFRAGATGLFDELTTCDVFIKSLELVIMGEMVFPPALLSCALHPAGDQALLDDDNNQAHSKAGSLGGLPEGQSGSGWSRRLLVAAADQVAPHLSPREKTILRCLIEGDSNKSIARKIDIAEATVKVYFKRIFHKIGVRNRTQAAIWAMNNGWQTPDANRACPPLAVDLSEQPSAPIEIISEIKQPDESISPGTTEGEANQIAHPLIDRLISNGVPRLRRSPTP
jgi:DNA-binding NarL/FixJ family response regulator